MTQESSYLSQIDEIAERAVAPQADAVDRTGAFPQHAVDALAKAGLMGLISGKSVGGLGLGARAAALTIERLARECGSTAMVMCMHYAGAAVLEKFAPEAVRRDVAAGRHLSTLAFSEAGSRSQFWAPVSTAARHNGKVRIDAKKSWVTSASKATAYVWSTRPVAAEGTSTIWLVPADTAGVRISGKFDGLGLRGNDSTPVSAEGAIIAESQMLGEDGMGLSVMLDVVLPIFNIMTASVSVGLMEGATQRTIAHVSRVRFEHSDSGLADLPTIRAYVARMRVMTDQARTLLMDTLDAIESGRPDGTLRVLECKAAAGEAATQVLDLSMRVCGGAAFRKDVGVERYFRDGRAASVMAPTTDQLYDFIGKALCGLPLF
jgi:alkylation response protein AidB-like acyl-CoA dehydrogenase